MNRQYVIDNDLVSRYLRQELSEAEREAFEIFYLDDQDTLDELEALSSLDRTLGTGTSADVAAEDAPTAPPAPSSNVTRLPTAEERRTSKPPTPAFTWLWPLATAAALVIGVAIGITTGRSPQAGSAATLQSATVVHIELMRSSEQPVFAIPTDGDSVLLKVAVGGHDSTYRLSLAGPNGQSLRSGSLRADVYGEVSVLLPIGALTSGDYQLQAIDVNSGQTAMSATLRLGTQSGRNGSGD